MRKTFVATLIAALLLAGCREARFWNVTQINVTADFNRQVPTPVIPVNLLGTGVSSIGGSAPYDGQRGSYLNALGQAGLHHVRLFVDMNQQCPNGVCGTWGIPDNQLRALTTADPNVRVLVDVQNTPANLGPKPCSPPSDALVWSSYVIRFLQHEQQVYPGVIDSVDLWNEPDAAPWCPANGDNKGTYKLFFKVAGPVIKKAQPTLLVGGPALASPGPNGKTWFGPDGIPSAWPEADFYDFHLYLNSTYASWEPLLSQMQSVGGGIGYYFRTMQGYLRAQGYKGQLWITEYNDSYAYAPDCCRFDLVYSPQWHVLAVADYLNVVLSSGAESLPDRLYVFTNENSAVNGFCLTGNVGCQNTTPPNTLRPPYFAYKLFNDLNLPSGGRVAASVTPGSTGAVSATAFYTSSNDAVVIVNPTTTSYEAVNIAFVNPGPVGTTCTRYLLNATNQPALVASCSLTPTNEGFGLTVNIPALSTVAVKLT